jgi:hypothetical protein
LRRGLPAILALEDADARPAVQDIYASSRYPEVHTLIVQRIVIDVIYFSWVTTG